ncbi:Protein DETOXIFICATION 27 [Bienertia sinuspersici]
MSNDDRWKTSDDQKVPFLEKYNSHNNPSSKQLVKHEINDDDDEYLVEHGTLVKRVCIESKKLWHIVGPSIISRIASFTMLVVTQAFAGHLGDLELAAVSIGCNVIVGLDFAYGAKKYHMLGIYMQRSWIVLFACGILLLPLYIFAGPLMKLLGQPEDVSDMAGVVALWMLPLHFSFAFQFPLQRFLQCQLKAGVVAWVTVVALVVQLFVSWLFVFVFKCGVIGVAVTQNFGWWVLVFGLFGYTALGGCPLTWAGFSMEAFSGLWEFVKLSAASGVMLCMSINGWELMIPLAFFAGAGVRVANELGAGNGKGAKFATVVAVLTSVVIGLFFWLLVLIFHEKVAFIYSTSPPVVEEVKKLSVLLAFTILLNSVQPVLSGVAVGSGWQSTVAYINIGCYYFLGGVWAGMIFGGTAVQTLILSIITIRCNWDKEAQRASLHALKWAESISDPTST